ncbi:MAG: 5'/3'-nucleotidase SurE [Dysgonamonadaceae bacterium]|nr:5'/3'-nucleotidase SurE [Dysgonamonadaceae bacterium]
MNENKPLIFITNDDGYLAKGVSVLAETVKDMGEIVVFVPDLPRSGMSGAITTSHALRAHIYKREENITTYVCNGTPVDCVKLALNEFLDRKPDIILSGINHGSNAGISVLYSGTMGAAIEGCIFDIPSVGFSLCDHAADADFEETKKVVRKIAKKVLEKGLPKRVCLNVNIPAGEVKGIKVATQTQGKWVSEYHRSKDGNGNDVFWLTGNFENWETDNEKTDEWVLANGYAAVVPVKIDATAYEFVDELNNLLIDKIL